MCPLARAEPIDAPRREAEVSQNAKVSMTFRIYQGEQLVRTETLAQDIIKVGKLPSSHLRIEDENVSRMHAVIEVTNPEEVYIIDLGSAAGTIVNGKKVNKGKLQNGDEILLGGTRIVVEMAAATQEDEPTVLGTRPAPVAPAAPPPAPAAAVANPFAANPFVGSPSAGGALPNPFAAPAAPVAAATAAPSHGHGHGGDEDSENIRYGIAASGPPVNPSDVETGNSAVEVVIMWGDMSVLHVAHLSPLRTFVVGESEAKPDYLIGAEVLGTSRMPLVVDAGGNAAVVIPQGATGQVTVGDQSLSIADLQAQGKLQPCAEAAGAMQYTLPAGATARVEFRGLTFVVKPTSEGRKVGVGGPGVQWGQQIWTFVSLGVHTAFLLMFYFLPPRPASLSLDLLSQDSRLVQYLMEPPETVEEETPEWLQEQEQNDDQEGGTGKRHKDDEGAMGQESHEKTTNRYGIEGPQDNPDPHMAREAAREQARTAGAIGVLQAMAGAWNSPTSPYGQESALGTDPMSALGALMGDQIGGNFGFGGLGLRGTGRGGGGTGEGTIGLGNLGTIGHGAGTGSGSGYGAGAGGFRGRSSSVPRIRTGEAEVRGSLSREVIRRVIRRHINEVRFCYEQELAQRPDLAGRVTVSFIIAATGAVQTASVANTTLNNARVETCVTQAVRRWTFPAPDGGGAVLVNYPFVLDSQG
jgi:TonB family protein